MRNARVADLVAQKIRSLDALAKSVAKVSNMLKKDFVHLSLNKKNPKELQAALNGYIKTVSFTIHFHCSSYHKLLNLVYMVKQTKFDAHNIWNR